MAASGPFVLPDPTVHRVFCRVANSPAIPFKDPYPVHRSGLTETYGPYENPSSLVSSHPSSCEFPSDRGGTGQKNRASSHILGNGTGTVRRCLSPAPTPRCRNSSPSSFLRSGLTVANRPGRNHRIDQPAGAEGAVERNADI